MKRRTFFISATALVCSLRHAWCDDPEGLLPNLEGPTAGGLQFWGDVAFFREWRIQRNIVTKHHRLLDGDDVRHAWGSLEACQAKLDEIRRRDKLPEMRGDAVLLLHGLSRSRRQMRQLDEFLANKHGFQVFRVGYPSTRVGVEHHASQLDSVIRSLNGIERIHFVAHSLGNLVIRRWMRLNLDLLTGQPRDNRTGRFVMLGPPNNRPSLARLLAPIDVTRLIAGQSARDLNADWDELEPKLAVPTGEFGIIAGGKGDAAGWNPVIPGDDDTTVGVAETQIAGASDFRVLRVTHRAMPTNARIHDLCQAFLKNGRFGEESERQRL